MDLLESLITWMLYSVSYHCLVKSGSVGRYKLSPLVSLRTLSIHSPKQHLLTKRDLAADRGFNETEIHILAKEDPVTAILEYIDQVKYNKNCTKSQTLSGFNYKFPEKAYEIYKEEVIEPARKTANVLNNIFRTWDLDEATLYNDAFYYSLARATVEDGSTNVVASAIAFDDRQYKGSNFCPYVYRNQRTGKVMISDLANVTKGRYLQADEPGYEWFWRQRQKDFSGVLWEHQETCTKVNPNDGPGKIMNSTTVISGDAEGAWTIPYFDCTGTKSWLVTYSVPFFGCTKDRELRFKGVVSIDVDLDKVDIDQCADDNSIFSKTHRCHTPSTQCTPVPKIGFRPGSYKCVCAPGFYFHGSNNHQYYNGSEIEREYKKMLLGYNNTYNTQYKCLPCQEGCQTCDDDSPCLAQYDVMLRGIPLGIQSFCMTISLVLGFVILKLRKTKVMKASMWAMLELLIFGALLLYATVVIQYFEPTVTTCLLVPWFREVGFAIVYGALILKIYRVLAEFQSRKAHRVHVRDKDLLKYLAGIILIVIGYMSAWTAVNMDHVREGIQMVDTGTTPEGLTYTICKAFWWDYTIEIAEFVFLVLAIYLCYCVRKAPADYRETRYVSIAIYIETIVSATVHIIRHFIWLNFQPDYIFLMYFARCQLTVTVALLLVLGPKLWYAHRPPEDEHFRNRAYSSSDVHDTILPESMKLQVGVSSNGDVDVGEINLSEMDPEDIRAELKRLYTQLQIYKTKTMRKDNPHISKRRGGRKQTHRRFSLQAFHYKHRHHHSSGGGGGDHDHDHELSKTPEESTNSAEGVTIQMDPSSCGTEEVRTPTVTFKPGHKSFT